MLNPNKRPSKAHGTMVCDSDKDLHGLIDAILEIQEDWEFGKIEVDLRDDHMIMLREPYEFFSTGEGSLYDTLQNFFEKVIDTYKSNPEKWDDDLDDFIWYLNIIEITLRFNDHEPISKLLYTCNVTLSCYVDQYTDGTYILETYLSDPEIKHYEYTTENLKKLGY